MTTIVYPAKKQLMDYETNLLKSFRSVANRQAEFTQFITPDEPFLLSDPGIVNVLTACPTVRYRKEGLTGTQEEGEDF